jgi:dipeptidyl aminopeptidase/acylaminoacyl peptidase
VLLLVAPSTRAAAPASGRAWELATPGPTNGVRLLAERAWSADGDRVVYASLGPMPGAPSGELVANGVATRTAAGWTTKPVGEPFTDPTTDLLASHPLAVSSDLSGWLWFSVQPLVPGAPVTPDAGMYRAEADGTLRLLGDVGDRGTFTFFGSSEDLHHAVFDTEAHVLPTDADRLAGGDAYEFAGSSLRLVGVDDTGTALSTCGSEIGDGDATDLGLHAISRDGARIFLSAPVASDCGVPRRVYLREDGARTTEISAAACTRPDCDAAQDVTFAGALADGSSAFLLTTQQLTNDDTDDGPDLYRYDVADHALTRISAGTPGASAGVSGAIRASDDGTRVYFVATGALVPGRGQDGRPNLYLDDDGRLRFLATADDLDLRNAEISSDGDTLVFATATPLLPSDTDSAVDVYRYDVAGGGLEQLSLGSDGRGNGAFDVSLNANSFAPLGRQPMRYASADASRVVFVTAEALVPQDVNEAADIYESTSGGGGSRLVSSGTGDDSLTYGGISADGRSVFFSTDESLLPSDRDGGDQDLYVARLGGGFAEPPSPPPCEGDACQGPPADRIVRPGPESLTYVEPSVSPRRRPFRVRQLDRRSRRLLATTGRATLAVDVPAAGRVSLVARARVDGRPSVVARAAATAHGPSTVRLRVRLSTPARRALRRLGSLRLTLIVRSSRLGAAPAIALRLRSAAP